MLLEKKEIQGHSIVCIGSFNPTIFQPEWFARNGLIAEKQVETAQIELIHKDLTIFSLDWLKLELTRDRFAISTLNEAFYEALRDLVFGIFKILKHTPINQAGFNFEYHVGISSNEEMLKFLNLVSPMAYWSKIFDDPEFGSILIKEKRKTKPDGFTSIRIEKSFRITNGLFFQFNDHFEFIESGMQQKDASGLLSTIDTYWSSSMDNSKLIIEKIWQAKNEFIK